MLSVHKLLASELPGEGESELSGEEGKEKVLGPGSYTNPQTFSCDSSRIPRKPQDLL